jgi:hypothetical protein
MSPVPEFVREHAEVEEAPRPVQVEEAGAASARPRAEAAEALADARLRIDTALGEERLSVNGERR